MLQTTPVSRCSLLGQTIYIAASIVLSAPVCIRSFDVTDSFSAVIKTATLQRWHHTDAMFVRYVANSLLFAARIWLQLIARHHIKATIQCVILLSKLSAGCDCESSASDRKPAVDVKPQHRCCVDRHCRLAA